MINRISSINNGGLVYFKPMPDDEHKRIMRKLMSYGILPTGNKIADYNLLRKIELDLAQAENCISNKFITVTKQEQEKIQKKKKEKKVENSPELYQDKLQGQQILAEQMKIALELKKRESI